VSKVIFTAAATSKIGQADASNSFFHRFISTRQGGSGFMELLANSHQL
jgi:hypothetical protein